MQSVRWAYISRNRKLMLVNLWQRGDVCPGVWEVRLSVVCRHRRAAFLGVDAGESPYAPRRLHQLFPAPRLQVLLSHLLCSPLWFHLFVLTRLLTYRITP